MLRRRQDDWEHYTKFNAAMASTQVPAPHRAPPAPPSSASLLARAANLPVVAGRRMRRSLLPVCACKAKDAHPTFKAFHNSIKGN